MVADCYSLVYRNFAKLLNYLYYIMDIIEIKNITKTYGQTVALDDVNIDIPQGSIYGLLGPNGAGKTTLIRLLNNMMKPDKGTIMFNGQPLSSAHLQSIGYLPEERGLYKNMKVGEQALYLARLKGIEKDLAYERLRTSFKKFGTEDWWDKKVAELSKGMAQKIQFIISVLHDPKLIILDEPFTGFDPINANILKKEVLQLKNEGKTIIISTHDMSSVEELCSHITLFNKSRVIEQGNVEEIKEKYKDNIFEIMYYGEPEKLSKKIKSQIYKTETDGNQNTANKVYLKIRNREEVDSMLRIAINEVKVISFKEVFPSMKEIFINMVNYKTEENI